MVVAVAAVVVADAAEKREDGCGCGFNMGLLTSFVSFRYFTSGFFSQSSFRNFVVSVFYSFLVSGCF